MALWLLAPAFNEEANIGPMLRSVRAQPWADSLRRVVIVDDGSRDRTVERAREGGAGLPLSVIEHEANRGPGAAFLTGFRAVLSDADPSDIVLTVEADNSADLQAAPAMIKACERGADACLASCYAPGGSLRNVPPIRLALSRAANAFVRVSVGLRKYRTCSSFFRAYRAGALQQAFEVHGDNLITESGFAAMVELLLKLDRLGLEIAEVPCVNDWSGRTGSSSLPIWRTTRRYLALVARQRRAARSGTR